MRFLLHIAAALLLAAGAAAEAARPRIVSLAPTLTETVYALGAGEFLVGVTRYCDYPPAAEKLPKVGGLNDLNFEVIIALKPTLVLKLGDYSGSTQPFDRLDIPVVATTNESVAEILESISKIGKSIGKSQEAAALTKRMSGRIEAVAGRTRGKPRPRVMVVVGGHTSSQGLDKLNVAGRGAIFDELVHLAGGTNAYRQLPGYPSFSVEGVLSINPEVIIDLVPAAAGALPAPKQVLKMWQEFPELRAVQQGRVHVMADEYIVNPGPRIVATLERFADVIHGKATKSAEGASTKKLRRRDD